MVQRSDSTSVTLESLAELLGGNLDWYVIVEEFRPFGNYPANLFPMRMLLESAPLSVLTSSPWCKPQLVKEVLEHHDL